MSAPVPANVYRWMEFNRTAIVTLLAARSNCLQIKAFRAAADTAVTCAVILSWSPACVDNGPGTQY